MISCSHWGMFRLDWLHESDHYVWIVGECGGPAVRSIP